MLSIEGKEVKLDDVADRTEKTEGDKKETDKVKKDPSKDSDKKSEAPDVARVFQFTIDCDYNKPRAEGEKPASAPQGK
jgi:hypothetical protein